MEPGNKDSFQVHEPSLNELCYRGNTALSEGRLGLLVDPGAWSNLAGENWIRSMVDVAVKAGLNVSQCGLPKPMKVAGVGNGANKAVWEIHVPIALGDTEDNVSLHEYRVPVGRLWEGTPGVARFAEPCQAELCPGDGSGNEHLTLPGPGGYSITWSPGTVWRKLEQSPSRHLILPCDEFGKVKKNQGGVKEPMMSFFGTRPTAKVTCEIGTQTDTVEEPARKQVTTRRNKHS